jgi:hypothetical protein
VLLCRRDRLPGDGREPRDGRKVRLRRVRYSVWLGQSEQFLHLIYLAKWKFVVLLSITAVWWFRVLGRVLCIFTAQWTLGLYVWQSESIADTYLPTSVKICLILFFQYVPGRRFNE